MRILGIDPNSKGIGFAVLENNDKLVDWGVKYLPKQRRNLFRLKTSCKFHRQNYLLIIENLINFYEPNVVVFEDWTARNSRRAVRIKKLLQQISLFVTKQKIASYLYSRIQLQAVFAQYETKTKYEIAVFLSHLFPELLPILPKKRKAWMSENLWMNMFTALAFCFVFFEKRD